VVPFFFIYYPALLFQGPWTEIALAALSGAVGVIALAAGLEGYFLRSATWLERGLFLGAALLLINPGVVTDVLGLALLGTAVASQKFRAPDALAAPTRVAS
jgi:TRAP-type uncharacterized transport system fused permease subunit